MIHILYMIFDHPQNILLCIGFIINCLIQNFIINLQIIKFFKNYDKDYKQVYLLFNTIKI